jgi:hypothetical protein
MGSANDLALPPAGIELPLLRSSIKTREGGWRFQTVPLVMLDGVNTDVLMKIADGGRNRPLR